MQLSSHTVGRFPRRIACPDKLWRFVSMNSGLYVQPTASSNKKARQTIRHVYFLSQLLKLSGLWDALVDFNCKGIHLSVFVWLIGRAPQSECVPSCQKRSSTPCSRAEPSRRKDMLCSTSYDDDTFFASTSFIVFAIFMRCFRSFTS